MDDTTRQEPRTQEAGFFIEIGNSDNKLSQSDWSIMCRDLENWILRSVPATVATPVEIRVFGIWYSKPDSPYQNMCVHFAAKWDERTSAFDAAVRLYAKGLARSFGQDSVAVTQTEPQQTRLITPGGLCPGPTGLEE